MAVGAKPPKVKKGWGTYTRNLWVRALVRTLSQHGYRATRNEASTLRSACDAVAEAAVKARVAGVSSYETVEDIWSERRHPFPYG